MRESIRREQTLENMRLRIGVDIRAEAARLSG
jgi:hypothetical protein